ncbi:MAG: hypothetical protein FWC89_00575 [Defluviitaleaceae bacterium]|nr:hypothetical protein [Defluviitaleaceae bacterium]
MTSRDEFFADWTVDINSEKYNEIDNRYFDIFEHWIPLQIIPQSITIEELEKEVDEAIRTGIDLAEKYDTNNEFDSDRVE